MVKLDICKGIEEVIMLNLPQIISLRNTGYLKHDNTYVSKGDLLCEELILSYLENVPNCKIISEELDNNVENLESFEYIITVDPIDGSENFVSGLKEWGVGVSVYRNMKHFQSMILLPELNIRLCTGDKIDRIKGSRICAFSSYMTPEDFKNVDNDFEIRIMGCCMYNMYNVISGSFKRFCHLKGCYSWDILPGLNLAIENGLNVIIEGKRYEGEFLYPNIKYCFEVQ